MRINGDIADMGNWNKGDGPKSMIKSDIEIKWLTGTTVRPWVFSVR
jgi:hypothetical protein